MTTSHTATTSYTRCSPLFSYAGFLLILCVARYKPTVFFFHPESVCGLSLDFCRAMSPVSSRDHIRSLLDMANKHDDRIIILIDMIQIADNTARRTQTNEARVQPTQRVLPNCLTACHDRNHARITTINYYCIISLQGSPSGLHLQPVSTTALTLRTQLRLTFEIPGGIAS